MIVNNIEELCKVVTYQGFNEILEKHDALEKALNGAKTWNDLYKAEYFMTLEQVRDNKLTDLGI